MNVKVITAGFILSLGFGITGIQASDRFVTSVDGQSEADWRSTIGNGGETGVQLGTPVGSSVGGAGASIQLAPATMQAIAAEMPAGETQAPVETTTRKFAGYGRQLETYCYWEAKGDCRDYRTRYTYRKCERTTTYLDGVVVNNEYRVTTGWALTNQSGSYFSQCNFS